MYFYLFILSIFFVLEKDLPFSNPIFMPPLTPLFYLFYFFSMVCDFVSFLWRIKVGQKSSNSVFFTKDKMWFFFFYDMNE